MKKLLFFFCILGMYGGVSAMHNAQRSAAMREDRVVRLVAQRHWGLLADELGGKGLTVDDLAKYDKSVFDMPDRDGKTFFQVLIDSAILFQDEARLSYQEIIAQLIVVDKVTHSIQLAYLATPEAKHDTVDALYNGILLIINTHKKYIQREVAGGQWPNLARYTLLHNLNPAYFEQLSVQQKQALANAVSQQATASQRKDFFNAWNAALMLSQTQTRRVGRGMYLAGAIVTALVGLLVYWYYNAPSYDECDETQAEEDNALPSGTTTAG